MQSFKELAQTLPEEGIIFDVVKQFSKELGDDSEVLGGLMTAESLRVRINSPGSEEQKQVSHAIALEYVLRREEDLAADIAAFEAQFKKEIHRAIRKRRETEVVISDSMDVDEKAQKRVKDKIADAQVEMALLLTEYHHVHTLAHSLVAQYTDTRITVVQNRMDNHFRVLAAQIAELFPGDANQEVRERLIDAVQEGRQIHEDSKARSLADIARIVTDSYAQPVEPSVNPRVAPVQAQAQVVRPAVVRVNAVSVPTVTVPNAAPVLAPKPPQPKALSAAEKEMERKKLAQAMGVNSTGIAIRDLLRFQLIELGYIRDLTNIAKLYPSQNTQTFINMLNHYKHDVMSNDFNAMQNHKAEITNLDNSQSDLKGKIIELMAGNDSFSNKLAAMERMNLANNIQANQPAADLNINKIEAPAVKVRA